MLKYLNNFAIATIFLLALGFGKSYATVVYDTSVDVITDSSNDPVSDTNGPALMAPSITTQPVNVTVTAYSMATFTVVAIGNPTPTYQWLQETPGTISFTPISGATSASYTTPPTTIDNNNTQYECIVKSPLGSVTSNVVALFVNDAPNIIAQPVNVSVVSPLTATFNILVTGNPAPTYQWQVKNPGANTFTPISGATSTSYTTPATSTSNNGAQYNCIVSNSLGSITSNSATLIVSSSAPTITSQPTSQTVVASNSATFSIAAKGDPLPTYQWQEETPGASSYTAISGATSSNYTTPVTTTSNNGTKYDCIVSNSIGSVTSGVAILTVTSSPVAPTITTQPVNQTVVAPATATFRVIATGTPTPTYQWMQSVNGGVFTNISSATSSSYTTGATSTANSGTQYECVVTNTLGSVTSNPATLTINPAVAPTITKQPSSVTVVTSAAASFSVTATGSPSPTYQWMQSFNGGAFTNIPSATSSSYTIGATSLANSGTQYECVITNIAGSVTSTPATLTVNSASAPSITVQPVNVTVIAPASASFLVTATGSPSPTYQWMQSVNGGAFTNIPSATSSTYTIASTLVANSGAKFECVVTNLSGSVTSNPATLTINPAVAPTITVQPVSVTVNAPLSAKFSVTATGTPAPKYQWMQSINGGAFSNIAGATSSLYTLAPTAVANSGTQYECVVSNQAGTVTTNVVSLTVHSASTNPSAPSIVLQPSSTTVVAPATATFIVAATGYPALSYQWMQEAPGATTYTAISGAVNSTYTTSATTTVNNGTKYKCVITNTLGTATSSAVTLTVIAAVAPSITMQPWNMWGMIAPTAVNFYITAAGTPAPNYQWMQKAPGTTAFTAISGANSTALSIPSTSVAMSGTQYECVVSNQAGSLTSTVVNLTVVTAAVPSITTQPINQTVAASSAAIFTVVANGNPTPTYQWMQSVNSGAFTNIPSATSSSYTIGSASVANSGTQYECVVTNPLGSVTSNPATLTVNPAVLPTITKQPINVTVISSAAASFSVTATGSPSPTYQWMRSVNGGAFTNIPSATSSSYTIGSTSVANSGTQYECVVTNIAGSVTSLPATLTVNPTIAPSITTQPINQTVTVASSATFSVAATGTPSPTYQWVQSINSGPFTNISSATSSTYKTGSTSVDMSGTQYECIVSNSAGSVTSNAATLTVKSSVTYIQNISYNANGQITQIQYGNGTTSAYTYNPFNFRLMRIYTSNAQAQVIQDLNYTYDSVGQVMSIIDNVNTGAASMNQNFTYDALNRLTSASGSYGNKNYAYDSIGNITLKEGLTYNYAETNSRINSSGTTIGNAGPHAVTSLSDGSTFKYDANGNMVTLQKVNNLTQYGYDSQNRLQKVTVGGLLVATYLYDGDGGRTEKTVVRRDLALYNDNTNALLFGSVDNPLPATAQNPTINTTISVGNLYESESGTSRNSKFIYLGSTRVASLDDSGNTFYYHTDYLGGTNVLTDQSGEVRELTEYDPFGQVTIHEKYGNNFATAWYYFTGKPLDDETGLIYLGARYYNPLLGRFITPDTVVQAPSNPQTLNRYTYCNNNPVNLVDPTGHSWWSKFWKSFGDFISPLFRAIVTGQWGHFFQQVVNMAEIVVGAVTGNPFLLAAGAISFFNTATSNFQGGGWSTFHQVAGYVSMGLAVIGGIQQIGQAFSQAGGVGLEAGDGDVLEPTANGATSSSAAASGASSLSNTVGTVNSVATSVTDKAALIPNITTAANHAGNVFSDILKNLPAFLEHSTVAARWTSFASFGVGVVAAATGDEPLAVAAFNAGKFFGGLSGVSSASQEIIDSGLRGAFVAAFSASVTMATEGTIGNTSIYGIGYFHETFSQVSGDAAGTTAECFANQRC